MQNNKTCSRSAVQNVKDKIIPVVRLKLIHLFHYLLDKQPNKFNAREQAEKMIH